MTLELILSSASLIVASFVGFKQIRMSKKQIKLSEDQIKISEEQQGIYSKIEVLDVKVSKINNSTTVKGIIGNAISGGINNSTIQ